MTSKLTLVQQRKIVKTLLTPAKRKLLKQHCRKCQEQAGSGFFDIFKSAGSWLVKNIGAAAKLIGPTVLKELVIPMIKSKMGGKGLRVAGGGLRVAGAPGKGLRVAGGAKKKRASPRKRTIKR